MPHEVEARDRMLRSVYTNVRLQLGIARDAFDDEEDDAAYQRVQVRMGEPQIGDDGRMFVANELDVQLAPYAKDAERPVKFWLLFDFGGELLAYDRIAHGGEVRPVTPVQGEAPLFPAGSLRVGLR